MLVVVHFVILNILVQNIKQQSNQTHHLISLRITVVEVVEVLVILVKYFKMLVVKMELEEVMAKLEFV